MKQIQTRITVRGISEAVVLNGLADLMHEFEQRPWMGDVRSIWDSKRVALNIDVEGEGEDAESIGQGVLDEVADCIVACICLTDETVSFDIEWSEIKPN